VEDPAHGRGRGGPRSEVEYFGPDGSFDIVTPGAVRELSHPEYDSMVAKGVVSSASSDFQAAMARAKLPMLNYKVTR